MSKLFPHHIPAILLVVCAVLGIVFSVRWQTFGLALPILLCLAGAFAFTVAAAEQRLLAEYQDARRFTLEKRRDEAVFCGFFFGILGIGLGLILILP